MQEIHPVLKPFRDSVYRKSHPLSAQRREDIRAQLVQGRKSLMGLYETEARPFTAPKETEEDKHQIEAWKRDRPSIEDAVANAFHNPFSVDASNIFLDLLTDSGTNTQTPMQVQILEQWRSEVSSPHTYSYARPVPRQQLDMTIAELFGDQFDFYLAVQGRAAEFLLLNALMEQNVLSSGDTILANRPFDTTKGHIVHAHANVVACTPMTDPQQYANAKTFFLGDIPLDALKKKAQETANPKAVLMTVTDNGGGGQPVSMTNYRAVVDFARSNNMLVWVDACRIFENAFFVHVFDDAYKDISLGEIMREMAADADILTFSAKKMYSHTGGGILINRDSKLLQDKTLQLGTSIKQLTTVVYGNGFDSYCGITGIEMIEMISGLYEAMQPERIAKRVLQVHNAGSMLQRYDVPAVTGGHAVYIAADQVMPHVDILDCPAEYLNSIIMASAMIRGCGLGNLLYGERGMEDGHPCLRNPGKVDNLRLAIPRETYTDGVLISGMEMIGRAYEAGLFQELAGGLFPTEFKDNGFYHFEGKFIEKDRGEFLDAVQNIHALFCDHAMMPAG